MHESTIKCLAQGPQDLTGNALTDSWRGHGSVVECLLCSFEDLAFREDKECRTLLNKCSLVISTASTGDVSGK